MAASASYTKGNPYAPHRDPRHDLRTLPPRRSRCLRLSRSSLASCQTCSVSSPTAPLALQGYVGLSGALGKGALPAATRERIALAVAEINGCNYCLSAHTYLGKNLAKLDDGEITANRSGTSNDPKAAAAVQFAAKVVRERGHVSEDDVRGGQGSGI